MNCKELTEGVFSRIDELPDSYVDLASPEFLTIFQADTLEDLVSREFPGDTILKYAVSYVKTINRNVSRENREYYTKMDSLLYRLPQSKLKRRAILI